MNSFIDHFFETGVHCDRKLQFNNRMPFHSYSIIWDSWQEGISAKSVRSRIPASMLKCSDLEVKSKCQVLANTILGKLKPLTGRRITLQFHTRTELDSLVV